MGSARSGWTRQLAYSFRATVSRRLLPAALRSAGLMGDERAADSTVVAVIVSSMSTLPSDANRRSHPPVGQRRPPAVADRLRPSGLVGQSQCCETGSGVKTDTAFEAERLQRNRFV